jgi:hypothetical protein
MNYRFTTILLMAFAASALAAPVSFTNQIKPILATRCEECHSGDEPDGGFDVTTFANLLKKGEKAGPGIVAGKPDNSAIVQYVEGKRKPRMPKKKDPLSAAEIKLVRDWITGGAVDDTGKAPAKPLSGPTSKPSIAVSWDAPVSFNPTDAAVVRRFLRLQLVQPAPAPAGAAVEGGNAIDQFIVAKWPKDGPTPVVCDDTTFARRVYLDLIGVIPAADEARKFADDKSPDKRAKLIDALLARNADYAANWVPFWEDALCSNGQHQGGVGTHGNYRQWILDSFSANKAYDVMTLELLDPSMPGNPGRYILNDNHTRTIQSAADTAQVFLGTAIKCASCHNHFENKEWPQDRAVAFAGFFAPKDLEVIRCEKKTGTFIPTHFMFDLPGAPAEIPADQKARLKLVAQSIVDPTNPRFAQTIVNRLWKRYMGLGVFEPADDYRQGVKPSYPELLAWLADDFARHGYDLKHTIRLILSSRTYQLRYDPSLEDSFDVAKLDRPRFYRSPNLRRLTAEQLLDSITLATTQKPLGAGRAYADDNSTVLTRALGRPSTRNEVSTARPDDVAVVQTLELLNGTEYHDRIYKGELIAALVKENDNAKRIDRVYWSALNRAPSDAERDLATTFLKDGGQSAEAIGDMLWALLSSPEFQYVR